MSLDTSITTVIERGCAIRYRQSNGCQINGTVTAIDRGYGTTLLTVQRFRDGGIAFVPLRAIVRQLAPAPVVIDIPEVVEVVQVPNAVSLSIGTKVTYTDTSGAPAHGWIQEMDGNTFLVERENTTLELIDRAAILTVCA